MISGYIKKAIPHSDIFVRDAEVHRPLMGENANSFGK
jgi:hypothetical protein